MIDCQCVVEVYTSIQRKNKYHRKRNEDWWWFLFFLLLCRQFIDINIKVILKQFVKKSLFHYVDIEELYINHNDDKQKKAKMKKQELDRLSRDRIVLIINNAHFFYIAKKNSYAFNFVLETWLKMVSKQLNGH